MVGRCDVAAIRDDRRSPPTSTHARGRADRAGRPRCSRRRGDASRSPRHSPPRDQRPRGEQRRQRERCSRLEPPRAPGCAALEQLRAADRSPGYLRTAFGPALAARSCATRSVDLAVARRDDARDRQRGARRGEHEARRRPGRAASSRRRACPAARAAPRRGSTCRRPSPMNSANTPRTRNSTRPTTIVRIWLRSSAPSATPNRQPSTIPVPTPM